MPWIVGIDEAGYGPNLGPLVMTAVSCQVPNELIDADLWHVLRDGVRRQREVDNGQIIVDDSKQVYSTAKGLAQLEATALVCSGRGEWPLPFPLHHLMEMMSLEGSAELTREPWYHGNSILPCTCVGERLAVLSARFAATCRQVGVHWNPVRSVIVCPTQFNTITMRHDSKGAVLAHGLTRLMQTYCQPDGTTEPIAVFVDKHGGRNNYAAMLHQAISDGMVVVQEESALKSTYHVLGLSRPVQVTFQPRADAAHLCVALASIVSKYLREVLMAEFNMFWKQHLPDLKPTAGYPVDAVRFWNAIHPVAERLGISKASLWRER
ncbi:MAG: hypothetical protein ACK4RK_01620 [Gemmataceae bacterium]